MLATAVKNQLVSGDGFDPAVNQGPLINELQFQKVDGIVRDAVSIKELVSSLAAGFIRL
jgi:acyl-CoA reductase-like NAD-dependent aldehyde dehydrogenase